MNCFSALKVMYLLQSAPTFLALATLDNIQKHIETSAESILKTEIDDAKWQQLTLLVKQGGFGLQSHDLTTPAYISSVKLTIHLVKAILGDENAV